MKIWIVNNYAIPPRFGGLVRHYYFSRFLQEAGHKVEIFTSSMIHNTDINMIEDGSLFRRVEVDGVNYTYVKTVSYQKNNYKRAMNMLQFPVNVVRTMKQYAKQQGLPDLIYASSPSPFCCKTALRFAKKHHIPFVQEVRDLWPLSLQLYGDVKPSNPFIRILYRLEHSLYAQADALIFTMAGGRDYVQSQGWQDVSPDKIHQINNGIDLAAFRTNEETVVYEDEDLDRTDRFKVIYCGSIRRVYDLDIILDLAKKIQTALPRVYFYLYGDGNYRESLQERCRREKIEHVIFKGRVKKEEIPSILRRGDVNLLHFQWTPLTKYGISNNKFFEYCASGVPIFSTVKSNYSLIEEHGLGVVAKSQSTEDLVEGLKTCLSWSEAERQAMGNREKTLIEHYDYRKLSEQLERIFRNVLQ